MRHANLSLAFAAMSAVAVLAVAPAAQAGSSWDEIRPVVFGDLAIHQAGELVQFTAPYRPKDQSMVPVKVEARFKDGRTIRSVTLIVDENPTPIAAVFDIGAKRTELEFATLLRLNAATDVRVIVEASDGELYMAERHVKFAGGQGACAAPPTGDPEEMIASMGEMTLTQTPSLAATTEIRPYAKLKVRHPNHTGMVLDQLTLLYVPLRIVTELEVRQGDERVFSVRGSITLSQDPSLDFDYRVNGAQSMHVKVKDSDGVSWQHSFPIGQGS
ncbi:MAG: quinoprotein dehydrogenase-associated SoxYZ-like carrier [Hyphomicrobium sp.]